MQSEFFFKQTLDKLGLRNMERRVASALLLAPLCIIVVALLPGGLSPAGKITLGVWLLAIIGWTLTPLNDTFVALAAAIILMLSDAFEAENFFASLGNSTIWLMIGAAIVGTAVNQSGLPARFTLAVTHHARTVSQLFYWLTAVLLLTALIIPSVAIRTTLMLPVYTLIATSFRDQRINRALALMLPINLILTSVASLFGDGAHLVINDTLGQLTGRPLSFFQWALMGLPFAAISAFGATRIILRRLLDESQRQLPIDKTSLVALPASRSLSWTQRYMLAVLILLLLLWLTESWHGLDSALIALLGAIAVTVPLVGVIKFEEAAANISWNVIAFVGATLFLSNALVESGAGGWLVNQLLVRTGVVELGSRLALMLGITVITLGSHLLITSRSTRGAVIAPGVVLLAYSTGLDPQTLAFITAAGIGYSITFFISARTLMAFQRLDGNDEGVLFTSLDLIRLSGVLAPFQALLIVLFGLFYWPIVGGGTAVSPAQAQERLQEAPITTGRPGLLQNRVVVPVEVLDQAGIRQVNGQFQISPPPQPTEAIPPTASPSPSPTSTPTLPLTATPRLTSTSPLSTTSELTTTPTLTPTPVLTATFVVTRTPVLTATPSLTTTLTVTATVELTTTLLTPTPVVTATSTLSTSPELAATPGLTITLTPAATPPTVEPATSTPAPAPSAPTGEAPATSEPEETTPPDEDERGIESEDEPAAGDPD
ncbi:MAG: anion permease [Anaerolineae bacterium]|nr:anion permease [Anaerolineae bacterium]